MGETPKNNLHTEKRCLLYEDLVPVSKDKLKVFGKSQLDVGALYRKPPELMSLFTPKAATNNIRLVFVYGKPNVTRAQLLSFHTTV